MQARISRFLVVVGVILTAAPFLPPSVASPPSTGAMDSCVSTACRAWAALWRDDLAAAETLWLEQLEDAKQRTDADAAVHALWGLAYVHERRHDDARVVDSLLQARRLASEKPSLLHTTSRRIAMTYDRIGRGSDAEHEWRDLAHSSTGESDLERHRRASALVGLASSYAGKGLIEQAVGTYEEAVKTLESIRSGTLLIETSLGALTELYEEQGRYHDASAACSSWLWYQTQLKASAAAITDATARCVRLSASKPEQR